MIKRSPSFKSFVDFSNYQLSKAIAINETAVFMSQRSQTTINQKAYSEIHIPSNSYERSSTSCILAICLRRKKTPPLVITKGMNDTTEFVSSVYVLRTEKLVAHKQQ